MTKLEEWVLPNGYRLEQHWIEGADNPRDDDEFKFTFYGFPHRNYKIGDETLDPGDVSEPCPAGCSEGTVWAENGQDVNECRRCDGRGEINPTNLDELMEMVGRRDNARLVRPVTMIDHSEVSYRLGRGAWACDPGGWDSGTCGIIVATWAQLEGRGGREWAEALSDETIEEWMSDEIDTYSAWAEGAVYEVLVFDPNGDEAETSVRRLVGLRRGPVRRAAAPGDRGGVEAGAAGEAVRRAADDRGGDPRAGGAPARCRRGCSRVGLRQAARNRTGGIMTTIEPLASEPLADHLDCTLLYCATVQETNRCYIERGVVRVGKNVGAWTQDWHIRCYEHQVEVLNPDDGSDLEWDI